MLIYRQSAIEAIDDVDLYHQNRNGEMIHGANPDEHQAWYKIQDVYEALDWVPSVEPKRKKNIIQNFHDYQVEWLKSHNDIELEPDLENLIIHFLHDTANCYMVEMDVRGEQDG